MSETEALTSVLQELIRQPSVVGFEHSFFRYLHRLLEERGARVTWYEGLLVAQGHDPRSALFSAHIDRHGLLCTGPNEFSTRPSWRGGAPTCWATPSPSS